MSSVIEQQFIDTWRINNQINLMVLDNIDEESLNATLSTKGGRTVGQQFAHIHNVRLNWLEICAKDLLKGQNKIEKEEKLSRSLLKKRLTESTSALDAIIKRSLAADGKIKGYKKGVVTMISYMIAHDAHHRGSILLTLKQTGHKLSEKLKWGIWEWDQI